MFAALALAALALVDGKPLRVGVAGGGPAGLALAHALRTLPGPCDIHVSVYEKYSELRPAVGGGIQLSSGAAVLSRLGLGEELRKASMPLRGVRSRRANGFEVLKLDIAAAMAEVGATRLGSGDDSAVAIMRDALQELLLAQLPEGTVRLGRALDTLRILDGGGVRCTFSDGGADGGAEVEEEEFDLLVGCDGIGSRVKVLGFPQADAAVDSGIRVVFCVSPNPVRPADTQSEFHQWLGDGCYCLSASYGALGGGVSDVLALCYTSDEAASENAGWVDNAQLKAQVVRRLQQAAMPQELIDLAEIASRCYETPVFFRNPSLGWSTGGCVSLAGDAAHAMPPFLGQGANQAICDAYTLAREIKQVGARNENVAEALRAYERKRIFPVARLLLNSRILGFLETQSGAGALFRDAFFFVTGKLGIAKKVFLDGAVPRGIDK